jgi:hypothetical protein
MTEVVDREALLAALDQQIDEVNRLSRLAVRGINVVIRLHCLPYFFDGMEQAQQALADLEAVVSELSSVALSPDPYCGNNPVDISGIRATSAHAAAFELARLTWDAVQLRSLESVDRTEHRSPKRERYTRVTFENVSRSWREVDWSKEVWQRICAQVSELPSVDHKQWETLLHFEHTHLERRFEERRAQLVLSNAAGPRRRAAKSNKPAAVRSRKMEARDRWIYNQCMEDELTFGAIVKELKRLAPKRGWQVFTSPQRVRQVAVDYAMRHNKPLPRSRQNF